MDLTGLYPFIAIGCAIFGLFVGSWCKRRTCVIVPFNDPLSWTLLLMVFVILLMPDLKPEWALIDPYDLNQDACLIGFFVMYIYGYCKEELLMEFVSAHDIFRLRQEIRPIAYYINADNQLCWQPQSIRYVLKRMIFNVDNPLDYDFSCINRRRYIEFQGKFLKMSAYVVDTAKMTVKDEYVYKWRLKFKVQRLHFDPSPVNSFDMYDFYVEGKIANEYVQNYQRLKVENANSSADMRMARILGVVDLMEGLTRMTPDAVVMDRLVSDMDARNGVTTEGDVRRADRAGKSDARAMERTRRMASKTRQQAGEGEVGDDAPAERRPVHDGDGPPAGDHRAARPQHDGDRVLRLVLHGREGGPLHH